MLRKHQKELLAIVDGIIEGSGIKKIIVSACPGSGKSLLPQIAGKLITAGKADALCWVVPRLTLQSQGESNFQDPFFRKILNHKLDIRSSTNDNDPCRSLDGFTTTFQALAVDDNRTVLPEFKRKRYILVIDENHHVAVIGNASWHEALKPLVDEAEYLILMTGTMARGDKEAIAFIPYADTDAGLAPDCRQTKETAVIVYSRSDALSEQAIIPLTFHLSGGQAKWINKEGALCHSDLVSASAEVVPQALMTAISTEFAEALLKKGLSHWQRLKRQNRSAKVLIVTANYKEALRISEKLDKEYLWLRSEIATSHQPERAQQAITHFKSGKIDALVAINMVSEGLDVPSATHVICLTNIRSTPWIEQMVARVVRVDPQAGQYESQVGHIFAPDDILLKKIVTSIEEEQRPFAKKTKPTQQGLFGDIGCDEIPNLKIQPLESTMSGQRDVFLGGGRAAIQLPETPSEIEGDLRRKIENHVRLYSFNNRYRNGALNSEIKAAIGKSRAEMTGAELAAAYQWVQETYPIDKVGRGSGIPRVSAEAVLWEG